MLLFDKPLDHAAVWRRIRSLMKLSDGNPPSVDARRKLQLCFDTLKPGKSKANLNPAACLVGSSTSPAFLDNTWGLICPRLTGMLKLSPHHELSACADELTYVGEIGTGGYGCVSHMRHRSGHEMAVKRILIRTDERSQRLLNRELEVVKKNSQYDDFSNCPYIITYYGTLFQEHHCYICMELMDTSLDKLYQGVFARHLYMPESVLKQVAYSTVRALDYLKIKWSMIHRDIKPGNILLNRKGEIKMCDFGVAGDLINSVAQTRDTGCIPYRAPERIAILQPGEGYDVRADVWSLGVTLIEVSTGRYPYEVSETAFQQLSNIADPLLAPRLRESHGFSPEYTDFVNQCLIYNHTLRPNYIELLEMPLLAQLQNDTEVVRRFLQEVLPLTTINRPTTPTTSESDDFVLVNLP